MASNTWVVKVGGSLFAGGYLPDWLALLAAHGGGRVVIVPGGGPFADQVRAAQQRWRFDDAVAHRMAMLGMAQYGMMLCGIQPDLEIATDEDAIRNIWRDRRVAVWAPTGRSIADLPAEWSVTSDSLAAWLAMRLSARYLLLVKSARIDMASIDAVELARRGIIDARFPDVIGGARCACHILNARDYALLVPALRGEPAGVRVTTDVSAAAEH